MYHRTQDSYSLRGTGCMETGVWNGGTEISNCQYYVDGCPLLTLISVDCDRSSLFPFSLG